MNRTPAAKKDPFRRAVVASVILHAALFSLIAASPSLPRSSKSGLVQYIPLSLGGLPGGGDRTTVKAPAKRETLRDLTVPQKLQEPPRSELTYPTEKPKKDTKPAAEKKAAISRPAQESGEKTSSGEAGAGPGSGVRIGLGSGPGSGTGFGSGYSSQIGLSDFPYTYYLQIVTDRISTNWFTSLVDPGVRGYFQTVVYFKIFKTGQTSELKVQESSGIPSLDLSALRAVQRSSPFPPLPREYDEEYLGVYLIFEHSK